MNYVIKPLDETGHSRTSLKKLKFNSKYPKLDDYIKKYAWINHCKKRTARVFVACSENNFKEIKGYYASCTSNFSIAALPEEDRSGFPSNIPAFLIGKLAVDLEAQNCGIGKSLLRHAFESAVDISEKTGVYAVWAEAIDQTAKQYYVEKCGFLEFQDEPLSVYLPIETIKMAIAN